MLDEHAAEVKRSERILGHPDEALAKNNQEIERLREIMSDSERAIFDELIDSELQIDQQKARENLIISRHEHRQIETEFKVMQEQETRERENGLRITAYFVSIVLGVLILLFLFR
ncbi:hypothetical protein [Pseudomonas shahriarae]